MTGNDWIAINGMYFVLGILAMITTVIVVVVWQSFATRRARMSVEREEAYRRLAEAAAGAIQKTAEGMDELRTRTAVIEKILQDVE